MLTHRACSASSGSRDPVAGCWWLFFAAAILPTIALWLAWQGAPEHVRGPAPQPVLGQQTCKVLSAG